MRATLTIGMAAALAACATGYDPQEIEAVRDYVAAAELPAVDQIRPNRDISYSYVNDRYVIIPTRRQDYLVEFDRDCFELRRTDFTYDMVDRRRDTNVLRTRADTIRGCRIKQFYELTDDQAKEIKNLGDAPGEEIFLPDQDD